MLSFNSFLKSFTSKSLYFLYIITFNLGLGCVILKRLSTFYENQIVVVHWKLEVLFVKIRSMQLGFSELLKRFSPH